MKPFDVIAICRVCVGISFEVAPDPLSFAAVKRTDDSFCRWLLHN